MMYTITAVRNVAMNYVSFRFAVLPSSAYLFAAGVEVFFYFHLVTLTQQSVGLLWTSDRRVAETST
jgi:hypothetical protein